MNFVVGDAPRREADLRTYLGERLAARRRGEALRCASAGELSDRASGGAKLRSDMAYTAVNGLNMYYEVHGAGPPLLLLHGGTVRSSISRRRSRS